MTRLERIYRIHELLRGARRPVPMRRFREELETSRNTITRDFEYLRDILGAPLIYDHERNGHLYDPDEPVFELPGFWMNASELQALLACEQLLEAVQPGLMAPRLAPLKQRIRQLLAESGREAEVISERVKVRPVHTRRVPEPVFVPVAQATLDGKRLDLAYRGRSSTGESSERRVHPQRLLHYRQNWYLLAWCEQAEDLRLFSLDRIAHPRVLSESARELDPGELDEFLGGSFGIFSGRARAHAHLHFSEHAAAWAAEEQWHPDQHGEWRDDGFHLTVPYSDPRELIRDILAWGPEVEVLAPEPLREQVRARLLDAARSYETPIGVTDTTPENL